MIRRLFRWLFAPPPERPTPLLRRVADLELAAEDYEKKLEYLYSEMKSLRGRVYALKRGEPDPEKEKEPENPPMIPTRTYPITAGLARRFKGT